MSDIIEESTVKPRRFRALEKALYAAIREMKNQWFTRDDIFERVEVGVLKGVERCLKRFVKSGVLACKRDTSQWESPDLYRWAQPDAELDVAIKHRKPAARASRKSYGRKSGNPRELRAWGGLYEILKRAFPELVDRGRLDVRTLATKLGVSRERVYQWLRTDALPYDQTIRIAVISRGAVGWKDFEKHLS